MLVDTCVRKRVFRNGYNTYEVIEDCDEIRIMKYNLGLHVGGPYVLEKSFDVDILLEIYDLEEVGVSGL